MNPTELVYRQAAVEGASGFGLLIALYDTLISDLRRASNAQRNQDIQSRCNHVNHALLILAFMEDWIDRDSRKELSRQFLSFYSNVRSTLITAQAKQSVNLLEQHIPELLKLRTMWQDLELSSPASKNNVSEFHGTATPNIALQAEPTELSWSA